MTHCQTPGMCSPFGGCTEKIPGLPEVRTGTPMPAYKPPRSESGLKPVAYIYTCRNPGQTSLLWAHQPPPFGHGWIDVKRVGLVREDDVEALRRDAERYRWLCNGNGYFMEEEMLCGHSNDKADADRQIDIAMTTGERS